MFRRLRAPIRRHGDEIERPAEDDAPLSALVFKIVTDPYVGRLAYFRVYSGKLSQGTMVYNSTKGTTRTHWPPDPHVC